MSGITESVVEEAALAWLESLGWGAAYRADIAPDTLGAEWTSYAEIVRLTACMTDF